MVAIQDNGRVVIADGTKTSVVHSSWISTLALDKPIFVSIDTHVPSLLVSSLILEWEVGF